MFVVPQGDSLGSFVYDVHKNNLFTIFDKTNCECIMNTTTIDSNDTTIVARGCDLAESC